MENEILNLLLETLKIQAQKYKIIVDDDSLTHEQRKEFDTEITQMYNVLANLSNSSTIYTLAELKGLKAQYDVKFAEFDEKVANLDLSHLLVSFDSLTQEQKDSLKGQDGLSSYEISKNNGFEGSESEWLLSLKGANGTFEDLTQEQKDSLKGKDGIDGVNGLSAFEIAQNEGFEGTQSEWLESLKGSGTGSGIEIQDVNELGTNLTQIYTTLGQLQGALSGGTISGININQLNSELQGLKNQVSVQSGQLSSILTRLATLENSSTGGSVEIVKQYNDVNEYVVSTPDLLQNQYYFAFKLGLQEFDAVTFILSNGTNTYLLEYEVSATVYGKNLELKSSNLPENIVQYPFYNINPDMEIFAFYLKFENENNEVIYPFNSYNIAITRDSNNLVSEFVEVTTDKNLYDGLPQPNFVG